MRPIEILIHFLCVTIPGISLVGAFVVSPERQHAPITKNPYAHYRQRSQKHYSSRRQDLYSDYDDYYPPPSAGFKEVEESLERQYRSTSRSRDSGIPFFQPPQDATITRFEYFDDDEEEDYYQDGDDDDRARGNFWVNPDGLDEVEERDGRRPRRRHNQPPKRRKSTTFRSGYPSVPPPVNELYNRLFWYGLDPDASSSPADRTMFGGTKGKFNGLSYLQETDGLPRPPRRRRRRPPPQATPQLIQDVDEDDYITGTEPSYEDDDDESDDSSFYSQNSRKRKQYSAPSDKERLVTPPFDMPLRRQDISRSSSRQNHQRPPKPAQESWDSPVARWFSDEDDQDEDVRETRRRKRPRKKDGWSAFNVVDAFLGIDRDELQSQAKDYEKRMGIDRNSPSRRRRRDRPIPEEIKQSARYNPLDLDEASVFDDDVIDTTANRVETPKGSEEEIPVIELSWEERALAIERVPPDGIPAWGPTGELDFDARTKAVMDALEDIATAKDRVENRKKRVDECREELSIIRIDLELQKKRLRESRLKSQAAVERLRRMDLNLENTARKLRRELIKLKNAKQDLVELEARHWAVLGFYDPEQAGVNVDDALRELKETEPAVRFLSEKEEDPATHDEDPASSFTSDESNV
ncbi:hypothetical protein FisN_4Lh541 [Fistulifera solaris]|uniref:Uncharacterized protein n=1 Tax=Fistulifera solaris TaxID=1519565 RepID=A0A1Z5KE02_FISSO|nr:hypothetical protein FisN_4Lh541 [Fistulifera solaris]|eukprot:GAX24406.1 hypothetical protein FisN_4Lh541 [Fistulifera solaris]